MMAWRFWLPEAANSKPLHVGIYAAVIYAAVVTGIVFSSLHVFSAVYASHGNALHWIIPSTSKVSQSPSKLMKPIWEVPASGSKMPPLENFRLSKELIQQRVKDNVIIMTFGNFAFMDFILTWVKHLTDMDVENLLVGAMDIKLLEALYWKGIPVFDMGSQMSTVDVEWGSPTFHKMGREKVILINSILPYGFELLMCDTDMVWLKNPLPYLARFPEADVLTSHDQVSPTAFDDSLDNGQYILAPYNIGIFHWRPSASSKKLAKEWKEMLQADDKMWDQSGFNALTRGRLGPFVEGDSGLFYAYDGSLKLGLLPGSIFCSGHTYFIQAMYQQLRLEPYAVHTTYQFAGSDGKRHRLREAMLFYDPPEYYNPPGGLLTFKPSIPINLLLWGDHNIETHFALINYQMKQIRTALAIASLLNRTLVLPHREFCKMGRSSPLKVMPPIWCRLDKFWFPHPGILLGTMTRQPFLCPLDHVFRVNGIVKKLPEHKFGPGINIREFSLFENPLMPQEVKESWLDVHLCQKGSQGCQDSNSTGQIGVLKFPKNSTEETFTTIFSSFKDVKVIQFSSMQDAFLGFSNKKREKKFRKRVKLYPSLWCCLQNHTPGHIYYDMYWDEKPNWKPVPPQGRESDLPPWEP